MSKLVLWITLVSLVVGITLGFLLCKLTGEPVVVQAQTEDRVIIKEIHTSASHTELVTDAVFNDAYEFVVEVNDGYTQNCGVPQVEDAPVLEVPEVETVIETKIIAPKVEPVTPAEIVEVEIPEPVETCDNANPGNHKCVGNAGENPNGKGGWGEGDRGKSR